jgi:Uma2 family endonuclease
MHVRTAASVYILTRLSPIATGGLMTSTVATRTSPRPKPAEPRSRRGTPTWEIARLFPDQGEWSEADYLELTPHRRIEYVDGCLEFLPVPTKTHAEVLQFLFRLLDDFVRSRKLGDVFVAGYRVRIRPGVYREPDVFFAAKGRKLEERFAHGADLVVEIVSEGKEHRDRDLVAKRKDYAAARIPEYWIVDSKTQTITVLVLKRRVYRVPGDFKPGQTATSLLLEGFAVDVTACFAAAKET